MLTFTTKEALKNHLKPLQQRGNKIGFVPTMGALHVGHISLVERSIAENSLTVVSIFVNPTQFNNAEDLENYPRTMKQDKELLGKTSNKIIVFCPTPNNLYNNNITSLHFDFGAIESVMEGKYRPGHFNGVGTVLTHLFNAVNPNKAYFGEKDYQQLQVVKKLIEINKSAINIVGCDIYREPNGLAYSSRNKRLTKSTKKQAAVIYKTLNKTKEMFGTNSAIQIKDFVASVFKNEANFELEYFEIADSLTLDSTQPIDHSKKYRAFIAVFAPDNVRLIDNIALN